MPGADEMGSAIVSGSDLDGDDIGDIAIASPCATVGTLKAAGRVQIFSSKTGGRLHSYKGTKAGQNFGASLAFYPDRDGDGRDELVIGSFKWDAGTLVGAGKVDVLSLDGEPLLSIEGFAANSNFGESVAVVPDVDGDGFEELLVGAGDDIVNKERRGRAYLLSGVDGVSIDSSSGALKFDAWGSTVCPAPDVDGDLVPDLVVGSNLADLTTVVTESGECATNADCTLSNAVCGPTDEVENDVPVFRCSKTVVSENAGVLRVLSGADMSQVLMSVAGAANDKLGQAVSAVDTYGVYAGAPGADVAGKNKAGTVTRFSWSGEVIEVITEPVPQIGGAFGSALSAVGDLDDDAETDLVVGAPERNQGGVMALGAVYAFSGLSQDVLWSVAGDRAALRLGSAVATAPDVNGDGIREVLVSAPGDAPRGRRHAGTVRLLSGANGAEIRRFNGRRGFETRFFAAGWGLGRVARVLSFDRKGKRGELAQEPFRGLSKGELSIAVLNAGVVDAGPKDLQVVVGTGHGADDDRVRIMRAGRQKFVEYEMNGFDGKFVGGVTVAAGNVSGDVDEDLIVVQADSSDTVVRARVFDAFDPDPSGRVSWMQVAQFRVFDDSTPGPSIKAAINADGANVAVGNVVAGVVSDLAEIVVGPIEGAPVVRVLDGAGTILAEWFAYSPRDNSGTSVALGDLDGDGRPEIVTAPMTGQPWVRAFNADGTAFKLGGTTVSFFAYDTTFTYGMRVGVADVDLDGRGEILVAPGAGPVCAVKAFEADGTPVARWVDVTPFGPACKDGLAIAGTDRFLRY